MKRMYSQKDNSKLVRKVLTSLLPYSKSKLKRPHFTEVKNVQIIWLGKRGVVQTILEDYRAQDIETETQEIQQFLHGTNEESLSC
jgi:hypothetical protein